MNFYAFSALIDSAVFIFVFSILLSKQNKPRAATVFSFSILSLLVWSISYFFWQISTTYDQALFWVKMLMVGAIFIEPSLLLFATALVNKEKKYLPLTIILTILAFFFVYLNFTSDKFISGLYTKLGIPFFPTGGLYFYIFLGQWILIVLFAMWLMFNNWKNTTGEEREMLEVMTISTLISFFAGGANYFLWLDIPIPPVTMLVTGAYGLAATLLLLKGKFYRLNLSYFEFFSGVAVLLSVLQFILSRQIDQIYINILTSTIVLLSSFFIFRFGTREREHLEKIVTLNAALTESLHKVINNISSAVIIISKNQTVVEANRSATEMFGYEVGDYPKTFLNFVRGKVNKALLYTLEDYTETGRSATSTTILIPKNRNVDVFFSPFTIQEKDDGIMIMYIETKEGPTPKI